MTRGEDLVLELAPEEATQIDGGYVLNIAVYVSGAFWAGFQFGYHELGPRIFG